MCNELIIVLSQFPIIDHRHQRYSCKQTNNRKTHRIMQLKFISWFYNMVSDAAPAGVQLNPLQIG